MPTNRTHYIQPEHQPLYLFSHTLYPSSNLHRVLLHVLVRIRDTCTTFTRSTSFLTAPSNADQSTKVGMLCVEYRWQCYATVYWEVSHIIFHRDPLGYPIVSQHLTLRLRASCSLYVQSGNTAIPSLARPCRRSDILRLRKIRTLRDYVARG